MSNAASAGNDPDPRSLTVRRQLVDECAHAGHMVQFYEDERFLCEDVARFLGAGIGAGEPLVVIATEAHWETVCEHLSSNAFDIERARRAGQLTVLDARATLSEILVDGMPDGGRFRALVGGLFETITAGRPGVRVRAFGEMVDLLYSEGHRRAALHLEELWNDLGKDHQLSLLCAYAMASFRGQDDDQPFGHVCDAHTCVIPAESYSRLESSDARLRQVSLLQRYAQALESARSEAEAMSRLKDEFLATVSHELRAPVTAILAWATLALAHPDMDARKVIETIEQNARSQARLIEDVLDVSRIVTGKLKLELRPIDLTVVLRAALDTVTPAAIAKDVMLDVRVASDPFYFHGDADRLQQVIWNLLSNAIKFTPKDGRIEIRLSRVGSAAEMVVHDTGCGIAADLLPHVFERFRQGSSAGRTAGGLGLGLTIARYLVELHGGTVTAQSAGEGRGATLTVVLPIRTSAPCGSDQASQQAVVGDTPRRPGAGLARRTARDRLRRRARRLRSRDQGSNLTSQDCPWPGSESDVDGDGERERRALSEGALDPNLAAVPVDDAPADGQAEPDARDRCIA